MFDLLIKSGLIIDGTGREKFKSDIAIKGGKILAIKSLPKKAKKVVEAKNFYVCPGFIDVTNHSDSFFTLFTAPYAESLVFQGVTTILGGACGSSLAPLASRSLLKELSSAVPWRPDIIFPPKKIFRGSFSVSKWKETPGLTINWLTMRHFLMELEKNKLSINFAAMIGHDTIRKSLVNDRVGSLFDYEIKNFQKILIEAYHEGAFGLSFGLSYFPNNFVEYEELRKLTLPFADKKLPVTFHLRDEEEGVLEAVKEVIQLTRENNLSSHISHFKMAGRKNWHLQEECLKLIEESVYNQGLDITFDVYPYTKGMPSLFSLMPKAAQKEGLAPFLKRLKNRETKEKLIKELKALPRDYGKMIVAFSPYNKSLVGCNLGQIAREKAKSAEEEILDLILASKGTIRCLDEENILSMDNLTKMVYHPLSYISSNGAAMSAKAAMKSGELTHPRSFGTFPLFLKKYVREGLLSWEEAVAKITYRPAAKFGIEKRGEIKKGNFADLVIFDPNKISDRATYEHPYQYPHGVEQVLVNGELVVENGKHTKKRPGRVLKRKEQRK